MTTKRCFSYHGPVIRPVTDEVVIKKWRMTISAESYKEACEKFEKMLYEKYWEDLKINRIYVKERVGL